MVVAVTRNMGWQSRPAHVLAQFPFRIPSLPPVPVLSGQVSAQLIP